MKWAKTPGWNPFFYVCLCLLTVTVAGCMSMGTTTVQIPRVEQLTPKKIKSGESRPVMFKRLVVKIPRGQIIGAIQGGAFCSNDRNWTWTRGGAAATDEEFAEVFRAELTTSGYSVVGKPEALFEEDLSALQAEYLIAGLVKDIKANICYPMAAFGMYSSVKGEAYIEVEWQVYSLRSRAVELKITTQGTGILDQSTSKGGTELFIQAFRSATRNLLANEKFYELVAVGQGESLAKQADIKPIEVGYVVSEKEASSQSIESLIADSRMAVVTILAGQRHGSGFLISSDGYLLTNDHVVENAPFVKVKFVTGREVNGDVVRTDRPRDVALVKLENDFYKALPVGSSDSVKPGSEVFAIGTPFKEDLGQTVTKGIISSFRELHGQRLIQSDVNIHPGNSGGPLLNKQGSVVGIAVMGLLVEPGNIGTGINYFIPIESALEALKIEKVKRQ